LHSPQAVLDLLAERVLRAEIDVGKKVGFVAWQDGRLVMQEFTKEMLRQTADENQIDRDWALAHVTTIAAIPKQEFSNDTRAILQTFGHAACDPAVSADGSGLLLLSDDMGLRLWAHSAFRVPGTWLQPVLMLARQEGVLTEERYFEAINIMAQSGHSYISLEPGSLLHQARKGGFALTSELERLLDAIGGPNADLVRNCGVAAKFLDHVLRECGDEFEAMRIGSQVLASMVKGRMGDQRQIIGLVAGQVKVRRKWFLGHTMAWLVGHSIGLPDFDEIAATYAVHTKNRDSHW
jgi:hypothetical protein